MTQYDGYINEIVLYVIIDPQGIIHTYLYPPSFPPVVGHLYEEWMISHLRKIPWFSAVSL